MKQITVPLDVQGKITDVSFHVGEPSSFVASPLQFQQGWLKQQRGLSVPRELAAFYTKIKTLADEKKVELPVNLMDAVPRLKQIAKENNVSFLDLCRYDLTPEETVWLDELETSVPGLKAAEPEKGAAPVPPDSARRKWVGALSRGIQETKSLTDEEKAKFGEEEIVLLLNGFNTDGDKIYNYLKLPLKNIELLLMAVEGGGKFEVRDFGEVIAAGLGAPAQELKREIESQYKYVSFPNANSE